MSNYYVTIGLEMHCEGSKSNSKVFSPAKNEYSDKSNINVCPIDMGFPGILPTLNEEVLKQSLMMSLILNARIPQYMYFVRKNYYYPDLPKGYQITQNPPEECVGNGGYIDIERDDESIFRVEIDNFHLEEDTARQTHLFNTTTLNYNRAGAPLFELVTKPCLHSADDVVAFLEYIRSVYQYCDISEADSKKGQIRCDVNVSISDNETTLGTKVEVKNVNSFSAIKEVIEYEVNRQSTLKDEGRYDEVVQETRRWDDESKTTIKMRNKEDIEDYKYFVEPNIPRFKIPTSLIDEVKARIPKLPYERVANYTTNLGLSKYDAKNIVKDKNIADYFDECVNLGMNPKNTANWLTVNIMGYLNKEDIEITDFYIKPAMLKTIFDKVADGTISSKQAKDIFNEALEKQVDPKELISSDNAQISDEASLGNMIDEILANNKDNVEAYHNGRTNLFQFFVGQVMKETKGKANPTLTAKILNEKLNK